MNINIEKSKIAIILLAYADFESLELALAAYSKFINDNQKIFILQNGRGSYDCERTYKVAKRYESLYPKNITVVDWISPDVPYKSIKSLLQSEVMKDFDYICKVDDDAFPLTEDWLEKLISCYEKSYEIHGENLAYVTSLVNNNPWGFKEILKIMNLDEQYFKKIAREHKVGAPDTDAIETHKIIPANIIYTGWCGTIWGNPYISRWLHENTTFFPMKMVEATKDLGYKEVDSNYRYSINCMFFNKKLWFDIDDTGKDDELMCLKYCRTNNKKIIADLSNPFIHLFFYSQRDENKDLLPKLREIYSNFLNLPYPISMCPLKEYENENRLRFIENIYLKQNFNVKRNIKLLEKIFSIKNRGQHKVLTILGIKIKIKRGV